MRRQPSLSVPSACEVPRPEEFLGSLVQLKSPDLRAIGIPSIILSRPGPDARDALRLGSKHLDQALSALQRPHHVRPRGKKPFDQLGIGAVTDAEPNNFGSAPPGHDPLRKILILAHDDRIIPIGITPHVVVRRLTKIQVENVLGLVPFPLEAMPENLGQLCVD